MKLNRQIVIRLNLYEDTHNGYVQADMGGLISMVWETTKDA